MYTICGENSIQNEKNNMSEFVKIDLFQPTSIKWRNVQTKNTKITNNENKQQNNHKNSLTTAINNGEILIVDTGNQCIRSIKKGKHRMECQQF